MSLAPVMIFAFGFTIMGLGVVSLSVTQNKTAKKTTDKWQSNTLAETGVQMLYDKIRMQMLSDQTYPFFLAQQTINVNDGQSTDTIGTTSAKVVGQRQVETDESWSGTKVRKYTYYFTLEGTGKADGGVESVVRSRHVGVIYRYLKSVSAYSSSTKPDTFSFPMGALVSNTSIAINTSQGFRTYSPSGSDAHVIANKGISWTPPSNKKNYSNPNILDIQGYWLVPTGGPYSQTVGDDGLGNPNGTKNYRSPSAPSSGSFPGAEANSVIKLDSAVSFANDGKVDKWAKDWLAQSKASGSTLYPSGVDSATVTPRPGDGKKGIQAPANITGDLNVAQGQKLELWPASTDPRKNVVYVSGNIKNLGQIVNHGVTLVFEQSYTDSSSSTYQIEPDPATFSDPAMAVMRSSLLSLKKGNDAFTFSTNSSSTTGLIYALKGGVKVKGSNAEFTGMVLSGGVGSLGGIDITPGGDASFVVKFDPNAATGGNLSVDSSSVIDVNYEPAGVASNYSTTKLTGWVRLK